MSKTSPVLYRYTGVKGLDAFLSKAYLTTYNKQDSAGWFINKNLIILSTGICNLKVSRNSDLQPFLKLLDLTDQSKIFGCFFHSC
jgi:hypothetical protein